MPQYRNGRRETAARRERGVQASRTRTRRQNPKRAGITGLICGVRVENIEDPLMREIRYLDKLVDELARGMKMESILRAG